MDPNRDIYIKRFIQNYPGSGRCSLYTHSWLWFALMESMFGGSIGKLATGIRVRRKDYGKAGLGVTTVRLIGKAISTPDSWSGLSAGLFRQKNQALHDKIAIHWWLKK